VVSRVSETPVEETVQLREQHATVARKPVNREVTDADMATFEEGTVEIRETAEEAVIGKTARVVEEVEVGTQVTQRDEKVSDTVRRTNVDVENCAGEKTAISGRRISK
jgi:stress response protein YsnF